MSKLVSKPVSKPVITRFAPSPTGYLHIGGARTALFNWLFARRHGGQFRLRIEDTDRARSTPDASAAILRGMKWLGLEHDGEIVSQFERAKRHAEVAHQMLATAHAYKCFSTQDEIAKFRETARDAGKSTLFASPWRDASPTDQPDAPFVIRLKAPREGRTVIDDQVQGKVTFQNNQLDDMICLRSDGSPTYMLAVVVDDHDMGVSHVIRGDDHLNNAARQTLVYQAMGWDIPVWAHIPLIHGADGKKLSKRHGALGVEEYQAMGYPPAAMRNYLARLGWSHGDDEFFSTKQAVEWFDLAAIGKSPSRFDFKKLDNLTGLHIAATDDHDLLSQIEAFLAATNQTALTAQQKDLMLRGMYCLKDRAKSLPQLIEKAEFTLTSRPIKPDEKAARLLDDVSRGILNQLTPLLQDVSWTRDALETAATGVAAANGAKFGQIAGPLRAALAGRTACPSVFDMMLVIGRDETIARLTDAIG